MDGASTELTASLLFIIDIMNMLCKAMAAGMHSWGAPAIGAYLSFAIIAFWRGGGGGGGGIWA